MKLISIVTGYYNEEGNIPELYRQLQDLFARWVSYNFEIIFIDNDSRDNTVSVLRQIAAQDKRVKVIVNARNFGAVRSVSYALTQAYGDAAVVMASDLQDPPALVDEFIKEWEQGYRIVL